MGFRNPVTNAVDQVARDAAAAAQNTADTGIIPGSRLAADAINGRTVTGVTITGGTVQTTTTASGARLKLDSATNALQVWCGGESLAAGDAAGTVSGAISGSSGAAVGRVLITPPFLGGAAKALRPPPLIVQGGSRDGTAPAQITWSGGASLGSLSVSATPVGATDVARLLDLPVPDTGWTTAGLLNAWIPYDTSVYPAPRFRLLTTQNVVEIQGLMKGGTPGNGLPAFILPVGYRPPLRIMTSQIGNNAIGRVDVAPTGEVFVMVGSVSFTSLQMTFSLF